jgi:hypothetical protein
MYLMVPTEGLEPPHLAAHGPEPCASTNSATWALLPKSLSDDAILAALGLQICGDLKKRDYRANSILVNSFVRTE